MKLSFIPMLTFCNPHFNACCPTLKYIFTGGSMDSNGMCLIAAISIWIIGPRSKLPLYQAINNALSIISVHKLYMYLHFSFMMRCME